MVKERIQKLLKYQTPSGLFVASPSHETGYNKAWLRDNCYVALAFLECGEYELAKSVLRAILRIFHLHRKKIQWAVDNYPHESWQYIHARYNADTLGEFHDAWGNKQNDAVGLALFVLGRYELEGGDLLTFDDIDMLQVVVSYLERIRYWETPDNGMWEEYEEVHASSIGACVAGLIEIGQYADVPDWLIEEGEKALERLLPRESQSRFTDLSLLSLVYPYKPQNCARTHEILKNVSYHLLREKGVIRYKNDRYFNANPDGYSEEAEWTMGIPWLSIAYSRIGEKDKAKYFLEKTKGLLIDGMLPELYYSNTSTPNPNFPLIWAEAMYLIALSSYNG